MLGLRMPPAATLGMLCTDTRLLCGLAGPAKPNPVPLVANDCPMSPSSSSYTVSGALFPTTVFSLPNLAYPGRVRCGEDGGEKSGCDGKPMECDVEVKPSEGNAGVGCDVSDGSEASLINGRRSAMARRLGELAPPRTSEAGTCASGEERVARCGQNALVEVVVLCCSIAG